MEKWKDIPGFEGLYQASTSGCIRSLDRPVNRFGGIRTQKGRVLKPENVKGYLRVLLYDGNHTLHKIFVHRAVGLTFIPNPENKPQINHIDCNKLNNCVENLEWNTSSENNSHAIANGRRPMPRDESHYKAKPVAQIKDGVQIKVWPAASVAAKELNYCRTHISNCARLGKTSQGFQWKYINQ